LNSGREILDKLSIQQQISPSPKIFVESKEALNNCPGKMCTKHELLSLEVKEVKKQLRRETTKCMSLEYEMSQKNKMAKELELHCQEISKSNAICKQKAIQLDVEFQELETSRKQNLEQTQNQQHTIAEFENQIGLLQQCNVQLSETLTETNETLFNERCQITQMKEHMEKQNTLLVQEINWTLSQYQLRVNELERDLEASRVAVTRALNPNDIEMVDAEPDHVAVLPAIPPALSPASIWLAALRNHAATDSNDIEMVDA